MTPGETGKPWTVNEVTATVSRYFDLFIMDLSGEPFVKAFVYRSLSAQFPSRTVSSIERKMSNISAVLVGLGYPHLRGLAPLANYQRSLVEAVLNELSERSVLDEVLENAVSRHIPIDPADIVRETSAPTKLVTDILHGRDVARPFKRNYLEREASNSALGFEGEAAVVRWERAFLRSVGQAKLAAQIEHVSQTRGDGLGYDILSFDPSGQEKRIEVKTTKYSIDVPFFLTRGEVRASNAWPERFHLYRLYAFGSRNGAGMYALPGNLSETCRLKSLTYEAVPRNH